MSAPVEGEAAFWRARYLELLQNHTAVIALMAKRDENAAQAQKIGKIGAALQQRKAAQQSETDSSSVLRDDQDGPQEEPAPSPLAEALIERRTAAKASARGPKAEQERQASQG